jgi:hypothetical protein
MMFGGENVSEIFTKTFAGTALGDWMKSRVIEAKKSNGKSLGPAQPLA